MEDWPAGVPPPDSLAQRVRYVGSGEHKARPVDGSYNLVPALRSDASRCNPTITREQAEDGLRQAIRNRCVSADFIGEYPCYVWGWIEGQPHVARLTNQAKGEYKGWPVTLIELPTCRDGRLTEEEGQ